VKAARHIISVSEATKRDLVNRFKVAPKDVTVVHPGVDVRGSSIFKEDIFSKDDFVDYVDLVARYKLRKPYLLYLGTLEPRKNVKGLCEAFVRAYKTSAAVRETELLVAGKPGWQDGGAVQAAKAAGRATKGAVRLVGYIEHRDKFPLMRSARAFVFPSFAEGFGLPVAEALALGVPTLVSDIPIFHEVAGRAALYADPKSAASLAKAIVKIADEEKLQARLTKEGPKRVKTFSWTKAAEETIRVYKKAMKR
jgi:glycosyltransferase involved in cell wall biosynthesis